MGKHGLMGEVSLLGLNEFGENPGLSPLWGVGIGGGTTALTSLVLGHTMGGKFAADRERNSFLAGLGVSAILYAIKSTRHAAFGSMLGSLFAAGVSWLEKAAGGAITLTNTQTQTAQAASGQAPTGIQGLGIARIHEIAKAKGLGIAKIHQLAPPRGGMNGLGLPAIHDVKKPVGAVGASGMAGFAGAQIGATAPVSLLGSPTSQSRQVSLLGGPPVHGLAASYGATLLGGGR